MPDPTTTPAPDRPTPSDPQTAAREIALEAGGNYGGDSPALRLVCRSAAGAAFNALAAAGLVITAPDAPSGMVCIPIDEARALHRLTLRMCFESQFATSWPEWARSAEVLDAALTAAGSGTVGAGEGE
jgi:hypothetical protein